MVDEEGIGRGFVWYDIQFAYDEFSVVVEYYSLAAITSIDDGYYPLCFDGASVIDFSGVTTFESCYSGLSDAFRGLSTTNSCDIYFNSLNTNSFVFEGGECVVFASFLSNRNSTSPATIHFPSNLQTLVSTLTGYPTFGAAEGMGICAFDLPATGSITTTTLSFSTAGVPMIDSYTIGGNTYTSSASVVLENNVPYTLSAVCHGDRLKVNSTLIALMFGGSEPWSLSCTVITDGTNVTFTGNNTSTYTTTVSTPIVMTSESSCCIPYYTKVNYFDGTTKSAEEVKIGDKLLGYNENTNKFEEVEVLCVIHKIRNQLVTVTTENHEIEITPDHPILTDKGWAVYDLNADGYNTIEKIQLTENLKVLTLDGYEQIVSISYRELDKAIDMYTFDVTDPIDTYVAAGIISHNEKC